MPINILEVRALEYGNLDSRNEGAKRADHGQKLRAVVGFDNVLLRQVGNTVQHTTGKYKAVSEHCDKTEKQKGEGEAASGKYTIRVRYLSRQISAPTALIYSRKRNLC